MLLGVSSARYDWGELLGDRDDRLEKFWLLFIWALLTQRWKLAEVFWSYGPEPVSAALSAGIMLRKMTKILKRNHLFGDTRKTLRDQQK